MIYTKSQIIGSTQVGADATMSIMGLFGIVETAITECMSKQHIDGLTIRRLYNAFWVFTKNKIKIFSNAQWGETVTVESFISNISLAKLDVDTVVKRTDGSIVAYSRCEMCPLDITTERIRRTLTVGVDDTIVVETPLTDVVFDKYDDINLPVVDTVVVRSTNIDYSKHCNNVEYLRFILNTYSVEELLARPFKKIEVCYISQSYEGDELFVCKSSLDGVDTVAIKKDNQTVIKCQIHF